MRASSCCRPTRGVEELRCVIDADGDGDGQGEALGLDHGHAPQVIQPYLRHLRVGGWGGGWSGVGGGGGGGGWAGGLLDGAGYLSA